MSFDNRFFFFNVKIGIVNKRLQPISYFFFNSHMIYKWFLTCFHIHIKTYYLPENVFLFLSRIVFVILYYFIIKKKKNASLRIV